MGHVCVLEKNFIIFKKKKNLSCSNFLTSPPQSSISCVCVCVCVCLLKKIPFYSGKKISFSPSFNFLTPCFLITVYGYVCFWMPYYIQKSRTSLRNVLASSVDTRILFKCGCLLFGIAQFSSSPPLPSFFPSSLSPRKGMYWQQKRGHSKKGSFANLYNSAPEKHTDWSRTFCTRNLHFSLGWKCH